MKTSVIGYPRVGSLRELKFATEKYFREEISAGSLEKTAKEIRKDNWRTQNSAGINYISSNDFSYYDGMLDTAVMLNATPKKYRNLELGGLETYFAMARGYQKNGKDIRAFAMKKWFNTNYHYMVPEIYDDTEIKLKDDGFLNGFKEAKALGIDTKPVITGGFTFLKLAKFFGKKKINDYTDDIINAYKDILKACNENKVSLLQIDEPMLVTDLSGEDIALFEKIYKEVLTEKGNVKVLCQTYFGDIRDCYNNVVSLDFDAVGLDFIEGKETMRLVEKNGFPQDKTLFAGVVNGKNIWKCHYLRVLSTLNRIKKKASDIVINTSCSLLHVPYTLENEISLDEDIKKYFAFAKEKLDELSELSDLSEKENYDSEVKYLDNINIFNCDRTHSNVDIQKAVSSLSDSDFTRSMPRAQRQKLQREKLGLGLLPTTTIGSFPQTAEVKHNRSRFRKGEISKEEYDKNVFAFIKDCVSLQEEIGLDVIVHGEFERNDMVEFFGENLEGYVFTEKAWVQSYGTRCVKPPIIFSDVKRSKPITTAYSAYANSLTDKPVKGMLTGPVTILNWSFPREDLSLKDMAYQIALAVRDEVLDLEAAGIEIIQIDEAALKEKLPIRRADWDSEYLDWAIKAFRLCHSRVKPETQIHTHMCYSEFEEIVKDIDNMDADVISFEASRSKLTIIDALNAAGFETEVGPGVYDIHSPRVPSVEEIKKAIMLMLEKIPKEKLWINPDCGLKTRGVKETTQSLKNLVAAAESIRSSI